MKKFLGFIIVFNLAMMPLVYAADQTAKVAKSDPAADAKREAMIKKIEEKKKELNGSEWKGILPPSDLKSKAEDDVLTFQNSQVRSKAFSERGFSPTNYTVSLPEGDEMAVWETMQTSAKEGVVFIRGEWKADNMHGIVSEQMEGGKSSKDYNFKTTSKASIKPVDDKNDKVNKKEDKTTDDKKDKKSNAKSSPAGTNVLENLESTHQDVSKTASTKSKN